MELEMLTNPEEYQFTMEPWLPSGREYSYSNIDSAIYCSSDGTTWRIRLYEET